MHKVAGWYLRFDQILDWKQKNQNRVFLTLGMLLTFKWCSGLNDAPGDGTWRRWNLQLPSMTCLFWHISPGQVSSGQHGHVRPEKDIGQAHVKLHRTLRTGLTVYSFKQSANQRVLIDLLLVIQIIIIITWSKFSCFHVPARSYLIYLIQLYWEYSAPEHDSNLNLKVL